MNKIPVLDRFAVGPVGNGLGPRAYPDVLEGVGQVTNLMLHNERHGPAAKPMDVDLSLVCLNNLDMGAVWERCLSLQAQVALASHTVYACCSIKSILSKTFSWICIGAAYGCRHAMYHCRSKPSRGLTAPRHWYKVKTVYLALLAWHIMISQAKVEEAEWSFKGVFWEVGNAMMPGFYWVLYHCMKCCLSYIDTS